MASFESVLFKMARAKDHFEELHRSVTAFYRSLEGEATLGEIPVNFGLIAGDCLQNMRSALDYLVTELVEANGNKPNTKHMFPIALTQDQYEQNVKQKLHGIHPRAEIYINAVQPYLLEDPKRSALYALDELTNLNKHRRPILTQMAGTQDELFTNFPHLRAIVTREDPRTKIIEKIPLKVWIGFQEPPADRFEVTLTLHGIANHIGQEILPLFKQFLS
jgi:hypothetical protein